MDRDGREWLCVVLDADLHLKFGERGLPQDDKSPPFSPGHLLKHRDRYHPPVDLKAILNPSPFVGRGLRPETCGSEHGGSREVRGPSVPSYLRP